MTDGLLAIHMRIEADIMARLKADMKKRDEYFAAHPEEAAKWRIKMDKMRTTPIVAEEIDYVARDAQVAYMNYVIGMVKDIRITIEETSRFLAPGSLIYDEAQRLKGLGLTDMPKFTGLNELIAKDWNAITERIHHLRYLLKLSQECCARDYARGLESWVNSTYFAWLPKDYNRDLGWKAGETLISRICGYIDIDKTMMIRFANWYRKALIDFESEMTAAWSDLYNCTLATFDNTEIIAAVEGYGSLIRGPAMASMRVPLEFISGRIDLLKAELEIPARTLQRSLCDKGCDDIDQAMKEMLHESLYESDLEDWHELFYRYGPVEAVVKRYPESLDLIPEKYQKCYTGRFLGT